MNLPDGMERIPDNQNSHTIEVTHVLKDPLKVLRSRPPCEEVVIPVMGLDKDVRPSGHVILEAISFIRSVEASGHLHQHPQPGVT